jgi:hypothetical protein
MFKNELHPELLGVMALNPFVMHDSASRLAMFGNHIGQCLVIKSPDVRRTLTGAEREYGKYTHAIKMPCDGTIVRQIHKYPRTMGNDSVEENPLTTIIYEDSLSANRQIGIINLVRHHVAHQYFGFNYQYTDLASQLQRGASVGEGAVIAHSPSLTRDGDYRYGSSAKIALMSIPQVIEDGAVACDEYLQKLTTKAYGTRICSFGKTHMPLNLYPGANGEYRPFPDIGERVREDGLLFALRPYDDMLSVVTMTQAALKRATLFDKTTYAIPGAKIIDIIIYKGDREKTMLPVTMAGQCLKYYGKSLTYYQALMDEYRRMKAELGSSLVITPQFQRLLVEAQAILNNKPGNRVNMMYKNAPLDEWMVEIVFEYDLVPTIGFKVTDTHGGMDHMVN